MKKIELREMLRNGKSVSEALSMGDGDLFYKDPDPKEDCDVAYVADLSLYFLSADLPVSEDAVNAVLSHVYTWADILELCRWNVRMAHTVLDNADGYDPFTELAADLSCASDEEAVGDWGQTKDVLITGPDDGKEHNLLVGETRVGDITALAEITEVDDFYDAIQLIKDTYAYLGSEDGIPDPYNMDHMMVQFAYISAADGLYPIKKEAVV